MKPKTLFNNDVDYAKTRLQESYVMAALEQGKRLCRVVEIQSGKSKKLDDAAIYLNVDENNFVANIKQIDFAVGRLGYSNCATGENGAEYVSRLPIRRDYRQGLRPSSVAIMEGFKYGGIGGEWLKLNAKALTKTILGLYPSFADVTYNVEDTGMAWAFDRSFAISKNFKLLYRSHAVGRVTREDKVKLDAEHSYLEQELVKAIGEANYVR